MRHAVDARGERELFDLYVTDALYSIQASWGNKPRLRYYDLIHPVPEDTRPAGTIAEERLARYGIKVV